MERREIASAVVLCASWIACSGCGRYDDTALKGRLTAIETAQAGLRDRFDGTNQKIVDLDFRLGLIEGNGERYSSASFDPSDAKGYSRIDTSNGTFLVSIQNVIPYVDGFKVTCDFGNPSSATYRGFTLKAKWGPRFDVRENGANYATWQAGLREKQIELTEQLRAGAWNPVSFVVSPAKADQFGYLELSMKTNSISLVK